MAATYSLLASSALTTTTATVTFSSIPGSYTDLVLKLTSRTNRASASSDNLGIKFNSATTNYTDTNLFRNQGGSAVSNRQNNNDLTFQYLGVSPAALATASTFSSAEIYIPSYAAALIKQSSTSTTFENNDATVATVGAHANLYNSASAITSITVLSSQGSFLAGSSFYLYGIKNS